MTDRIQKLCFAFSLAALLMPFSGCRKGTTETPAKNPTVETDERPYGDAAHQVQRYPQELLAGATLMSPDIRVAAKRLPLIENAEAVQPTIRAVAAETRVNVFRLPPATTNNAEGEVQIQVGKSTSNIIRLPDIDQQVKPTEKNIAVKPSDAPATEPDVATLGREQSLWAAARAQSAWTQRDEVTPPAKPKAEAPTTTPAHTTIDIVKRLPAVVESPNSTKPVVMLPVATELSSDRPAKEVVESQPPAIDPMRAVNQQAVNTIRHAFSLAQRGANYSARIELVEAMRTIAEALDMRDGSRQHTDALKQGFRALEEANDFHQRGLAEELDMEVLVAAHRTPVLKQHDLTNTTPLIGLQKYLTYAQEQLTIAAGEQPTASLALYGLGRLQVDLSSAEKDALPQAIVFHQAAVLADGMNYKAANELGVLLAKYGQYTQAREMLAHSVRVCPQVASWQNLAKIHAHLGEADLARRAMHESQLAAQSSARRSGDVRWVDPATLAGTIETSEPVSHVPPRREVETASPARNVSQGESEGLMRLIPWMRRGE